MVSIRWKEHARRRRGLCGYAQLKIFSSPYPLYAFNVSYSSLLQNIHSLVYSVVLKLHAIVVVSEDSLGMRELIFNNHSFGYTFRLGSHGIINVDFFIDGKHCITYQMLYHWKAKRHYTRKKKLFPRSKFISKSFSSCFEVNLVHNVVPWLMFWLIVNWFFFISFIFRSSK